MLKDILTKRFTSKWWLETKVEPEKIRYILDCLYECPSKQNKYNYTIHVLNDSKKANEIKEWMYWEDSVCVEGHRKIRPLSGDPLLNRFNGQVLAPIVMTWIAEFKNKYKKNDKINDCVLSSTVAMLAAEECGLNTGFCGCMSRRGTAEKLGHNKDAEAVISIGIGYGVPAAKSNIMKAEVYNRDGIHVGWDHMNVDSSIKTTWNRKFKPSKDSFIKIT